MRMFVLVSALSFLAEFEPPDVIANVCAREQAHLG
jgi:hypothetical protein